MRKQTKLVAVLSAAALLAIGASMTSFAAQGWTEEDGTWVYVDNDGYKVTDAWKKSGNFWYYLDEDGYMATSKLIENGDESGNIYYVDETGRMVANKWVELENENYYDNADDEEPETNWYYFQNSGKAYKTSGSTSWKTINGKKYAFDTDGHMLFGWVGTESNRFTGDDAYSNAEALYYCGDANDGARVTNDWRYLYVGNSGPADSEDDTYWFYFQNNGQKMRETVNDEGKVTYTKKINGKTYGFDAAGIMISEWHKSSTEIASELLGYYSDSESGARQKGWFKAVPSEKIDSTAHNDDDAKWYYGNNDGTLVVKQLKTIGGKKYAFDEKGAMMSGLWAIEVGTDNKIIASEKIDKEGEVGDDYAKTVKAVGDNEKAEVYYFGSSDDGAQKTGNQNVEVDGTTYQFSFGKNGSEKGKGIKSTANTFYVYGKRIKASTDYRYQAADENGVLYTEKDAIGNTLINTSGTIMKSATSVYTDSEGRQYKVDSKGEVVNFKWKDDVNWTK